ncbi:hypothetical protein HHK36_011720 [Tetracentron sinense]|uniref:R13L1/DRL21-like LRR repeat region domain-containing protein n=1 Tax=Tetracentron sinense TaxID=13715 RepID=A0A834ZC70_TETSI|nr:hypothetical protein HHK36_011720 [Tetracentron sinense]
MPVAEILLSASLQVLFDRLEDGLEGNMRYEVPRIARHSSYLGEEYDRITKFQPFYEVKDLSNGVGLQHFASLKNLEISNCPQLVIMSNEDTELAADLEYLTIRDCGNLEKLPQGLHNLTSLQKLEINGCSALGSFPEMGLPSMLRLVEIINCKNLKSLPEGMIHNNTFLQELNIQNCDSLTSFPRGGLPTSLEYLCINGCSSLESLPEQMQNNTSLEKLEITKCHSVTIFPRGLWLSTATLKSLTIWDSIEIIEWCNIDSLLEGLCNLSSLQDLHIEECPSLVSFPEEGLLNNIETLHIVTCKNLKALPNQMHNLTSLQYLRIKECPSLVSFPEEGLPNNIKTLQIERCKNLKALPHRMHNLTSLQDLIIRSCSNLSFPEGGLPTNLIELHIWECENLDQPLSEWGFQRLPSLARFFIGKSNLQSLPKGLHSLTSLEVLGISNCQKIASFSKVGLPLMLCKLVILDCPLLSKRCRQGKGADWPKIAHIPLIEIGGEEII